MSKPTTKTAINLPEVKVMLRSFFDREAVMSRVPAAELKVMRESGFIVMQAARWLLKSTGSKVSKAYKQFHAGEITAEQRDKRIARIQKPSPPGSPPKSRTGYLKDYILYALDANRHVIVGPAKLPGTPVDPTVPQLLEEGGDFLGTELEGTGEWTTDEDGEPRQLLRRKTVTKHMPARPYMSTALAKPAVQSRLAKIWADSIKA